MSNQPTTGHSENFRDGFTDGRLVNKTFERNSKPVIDGLVSYLGGATGNALEIGSGTGQHICAFARALPDLQWTPSEPDKIHRTSINAWRNHAESLANPAIEIDASADWATLPEVQKISPLTLVLSMNVIHIAPFGVARGMIQGAGKSLAPGGYLTFYGPFAENGTHTGEGNRIFDERLRAENPEWGVRDVAELLAHASANGMEFARLLEMPSNNRLLMFQKPV
ncbi:MAG: DUF938 domain-containing protein [Rhodobacteraceae bacterium]|nr:DUF938 domain-containing protein [Paracoccaceae bacterium]